MNKIIMEKGNIIPKIDEKIKYELTSETFGINTLKIDILSDTDLELEYNFTNKLEVMINVQEKKQVNIIEKIKGEETKIRTKYNLNKNSIANISKFNNINKIKEYVIINLEETSSIKYILKTLSQEKEEYDILTYHNGKKSKSEIITNGVTINDGKITLNISTFVPKNSKNCIAHQNNKIINLTENESIIKPNLYIDEYDVEASHSAWIGNFNEQQLLYLKSRGINKKEAEKLLIKGFLTNNLETLKEEIIEKIDNYWR